MAEQSVDEQSAGGARRGRRFGPFRGQLAIAVLCGLLGFAIVTQVDTAASAKLKAARQPDLVDVLDNLNTRADQLRAQIAAQESTLNDLTSGTDQTRAALTEAQRQLEALEVYAGTVPVAGPGIDLAIDDPTHAVTADVLVDTIQELRDAGAEAIEIKGSPLPSTRTPANGAGPSAAQPDVRLIASSYVLNASDGQGIVVDGVAMAPPYDVVAIGDPQTLDRALGIPGGVLDTLKSKNARGTVVRHERVEITVVRTPAAPSHLEPVPSVSTK
ncbi:protein of unknown function DUF881 [Acidothermus cellulolyticus 11B]|uniref:DUF881 domain-containing protein n=1 Tax=Acidothermus cellulolyticus (strain ATCC 43068 / DSM 8971 / 11B) TaxID=351607 RepID=A0LU90_ACIC1|nr:DUF881 domain-containing protein [Acidothermus cellulolyticus]ABK53000.1 protein of unknown function DUF881 [Acidothermus cellulolyticus 11B]